MIRYAVSDELGSDSDTANELYFEYLKFLALKIAHTDDEGKIFSPPPPVLRLWHAHILDTASYKTVCDHFLGDGIVLHRAVEHADMDDFYKFSRLDARRRRTYIAYERAFSASPQEMKTWAYKYWFNPPKQSDAILPCAHNFKLHEAYEKCLADEGHSRKTGVIPVPDEAKLAAAMRKLADAGSNKRMLEEDQTSE